MKLNIVDVENGHHPITGQYVKGRAVYAFYACGHCSGQQLHEDLKTTPEYWCSHCSRYLCKRPLCHSRCTPLYDLAKDRFESTGAHGLLVPAIMAGATTPEQAIALGFSKETFNG